MGSFKLTTTRLTKTQIWKQALHDFQNCFPFFLQIGIRNKKGHRNGEALHLMPPPRMNGCPTPHTMGSFKLTTTRLTKTQILKQIYSPPFTGEILTFPFTL